MSRGSADLLRAYRDKRDFARTPEPDGAGDAAGRSRGEAGEGRFVIQKHAASRMHFDFRLELDGVLKNWAVTKGPSLDPADKRLAVRTEDHPLDYADFEGVIPDGYGAGTVMIWDEGQWSPRGDPREGLRRGELKFTLNGERLRGGWALVLMRGKSSGRRENWLLVKECDGDEDERCDPVEAWTCSVRSGRDLAGIEAAAARGEGERLGEAAAIELPAFTEPQLARLADRPPEGTGWLHELKLDGYRIQALLSGGRVRLMTRNGKDWTDRYPGIARALTRLAVGSAALDGELVALDEEGRSRFSALQAGAADDGDSVLAYYAFDCLSLEGVDLTDEPLTARKAALALVLQDDDPVIRYCNHIEGRGPRVIEKACAMGLEGLVSKKATAPYRSGRGSAWIKSKCIGRDEFVIGGYRRSDKAGRPFASLLLGEFEGDSLVYRGRVGTGFDERQLDELARRLAPLERDAPVFDGLPADAKRGTVWLAPELVCEIGYTERTADGLLRHPSFLGLRTDKPARAVQTREAKAMAEGDGADEDGGDGKRGDETETLCGVRLTHPDRVMFDGQGATKREIAGYMAEVAPRMLVHLSGRPASLVRCPSGASGSCFFQKHVTASTPSEIGRTGIEEKDGDVKPYLLLNSVEALVVAAQIGALELHIWGARTDRLERPDRLVIDLDPDETLGFAAVRQAALEVREVLESAGLRSFALLTGGKGIHVVAPLVRRRGWDEVKAAARGLARQLSAAAPDTYVAEASKAKRKGRIFIDWLRNERGATAICPYSLRARPGAPVATPVRWDELGRIDAADAYTLATIRQRLAGLGEEPWEGYGTLRQSITSGVLDVLAG